MNHTDHVNLLRAGIPEPGGLWADLGSGRGAFTLALAELIGPGGRIISVDKDRTALRSQEQALASRFPAVPVEFRAADFTRPLDLPPLDGMVIANALHYTRDKLPLVRHLRAMLRPGGRLLIVEYNVEHGNLAVPYPLSCAHWVDLAGRAGFVGTRLLMTVPSSFLKEFYSALSLNP